MPSKLLFSAGAKGGNGKSTAARFLATYLREHAMDPLLIDLDDENKTLSRFFPEALQVEALHGRGRLGSCFSAASPSILALELFLILSVHFFPRSILLIDEGVVSLLNRCSSKVPPPAMRAFEMHRAPRVWWCRSMRSKGGLQ